MTLKRSIGTTGMLFAAVAGIMGSGWLFGPYFAARIAGPSAVLAWVIGGCLMMVVALTFAELSSTFPLPGASVRFMQISHGPLVSFTMAWIGWISSAAVAPIETMAIIQYAANEFPRLVHHVGSEDLLSDYGFIIAAIIMFGLCLLNFYGVKLLSKANNVVVIFKVAIPLLVAFVLIFSAFHASNFVSHGFMPSGFKAIASALPTAGVIFSFIGYSPAIQLSGEAKNPQRSLPIAIIGALIITIVIYVLLQIAFVGALGSHTIANGWSALHFKDETGPFAGMAIALGAVWLTSVIYFGAILSPLGTGLIYTATAARMTYAMGENGYMPKFLMKLNKHKIPVRIILLNYVIGLMIFLPFPTWQKMIGFLVSALVFAYGVGPLALNVLRKKLPNQPRPFRIPIPNVFCIVAFYICNLIIFWSGWSIISRMIIVLGIGYFLFAIYKITHLRSTLKLEWHKAWWLFPYIVCLALISYLGSFGGGTGAIPFGPDFAVIAVMSAAIYWLSQRCAGVTPDVSQVTS